MESANALPLYILAGGQSRRFGSDKARALIEEKTLVVRVAEALAPTSAQVTVVARDAGQYEDLGLTTIGDEVTGLGPMGGLLTALKRREIKHGPGWVIVASCDWVNPDPRWLEPLVGAVMDEPSAKYRPAVAFKDERWQPLPGLYHTSLLPRVEQSIAGASQALWRLLGEVSAQALPLAEVGVTLHQANTPEALQRFLQTNSSQSG